MNAFHAICRPRTSDATPRNPLVLLRPSGSALAPRSGRLGPCRRKRTGLRPGGRWPAAAAAAAAFGRRFGSASLRLLPRPSGWGPSAPSPLPLASLRGGGRGPAAVLSPLPRQQQQSRAEQRAASRPLARSSSSRVLSLSRRRPLVSAGASAEAAEHSRKAVSV
jgi:hypothetical protein